MQTKAKKSKNRGSKAHPADKVALLTPARPTLTQTEASPVEQTSNNALAAPEASTPDPVLAPALPTPRPETPPEPVVAAATAETTTAPPTPLPSPRDNCTAGAWAGMEEAVVGLAHRARNQPCQDAVQLKVHPRPILVLADGAGSAKLSHLGAGAVVRGVARLVLSLESSFSQLLDQPHSETSQARQWALTLVKHARGLLEDLAASEWREVDELRCTLLVCIVGKVRSLWLKVGDGAIVVAEAAAEHGELRQSLRVVGDIGKGEFANQTTFIDKVTPDQVQWGVFASDNLAGVALMSDGAAERLVADDGQRVAERMHTLFAHAAEGKLARQTLTQMFYAPEFCQRSTGDDRSMVLVARPFSLVPHQPPAPPPTPLAPALAEQASVPKTKPDVRYKKRHKQS